MSWGEEFSSNESGWTKYLGSPSQGEGNYSSGVYDDECNYYHTYDVAASSHRRGGAKHKDSDDNDSVASDASSGPSHHVCSKYRAVDEDEDKGKGKAAKEPVVDHKAKKGMMGLKQKLQKRGKKTN